MDETIIRVLFALLRSGMQGRPLTDAEKRLYKPEQLPAIYRLSKAHDIAHLIGLALERNGLSGAPESEEKFQKKQFIAVLRYEQLNYVQNQMFAALEAAQIPFLPLKGTVIRSLYPEGWMRTSCDVDVLVRPEHLEQAMVCLEQSCGYVRRGKGSHDVNLLTPDRQHVELHYTLMEDEHAGAQVLKYVWDHATPVEGWQYRQEIPDDLFYYYHIAHMAKHFELGGCGIRPLIDLWLLDKQDRDSQKRDLLLAQGGLLQFANAARRLSVCWMENGEADGLSRQMEQFILFGGVYGTRENLVKVHQVKKGSKGRYALSRIVLPYDVLKFQYPVLEEHRWLLPVCQVRRWCRLVFGGRLKSSIRELSINQDIKEDQADETKRFLQELGLLQA